MSAYYCFILTLFRDYWNRFLHYFVEVTEQEKGGMPRSCRHPAIDSVISSDAPDQYPDLREQYLDLNEQYFDLNEQFLDLTEQYFDLTEQYLVLSEQYFDLTEARLCYSSLLASDKC
jgi:hypothetical protein